MSQIFTETHTGKNSLANQPDFFSARDTKPITCEFVSAVQFAALAPGFDDSKLRRLAADINPATSAPWIPKPIRGKYSLHPTVSGVIAWLEHQRTVRSGLPEQYASLGDFEAQTKFPRAMIEYALAKGCQCRDAANRVSLTPFLEHFAPIFRKMFAGGAVAIKGVEGMEDLDLEFQRARVAKEDADERARDNALANSLIHTKDGLKEELWENGLKDVAEAWKRYEKSTGANLRKILAAANVPADVAAAVIAEAVRGVTAPVEKLRALLPEKSATPSSQN